MRKNGRNKTMVPNLCIIYKDIECNDIFCIIVAFNYFRCIYATAEDARALSIATLKSL
jgi:hypothetical protein